MKEVDFQEKEIRFYLNGQPVSAAAGQTIAAALLADGRRILRRTPGSNASRAIFCGIGICFDCLVTVDDQPHVRACITPVQPGMRVHLELEQP